MECFSHKITHNLHVWVGYKSDLENWRSKIKINWKDQDQLKIDLDHPKDRDHQWWSWRSRSKIVILPISASNASATELFNSNNPLFFPFPLFRYYRTFFARPNWIPPQHDFNWSAANSGGIWFRSGKTKEKSMKKRDFADVGNLMRAAKRCRFKSSPHFKT